MSTITGRKELRMRSKGVDLLEERTFADVSDQFDPPDFAALDDELMSLSAAVDDDFCCTRCP
ncbi:hypothetical protein [Allorhizocola rhizosphaerae]|uniref:hypothetical protein n=1 Tax=Allorhizocola rhizosphaerae TaxID=1872709 RepID=UPI000E3DB070|nr:hypothetical protein [Allorhizocola rhizosphaerae]